MIGQKLKEWRKNKNLSRKEMAETTGISQTTIQNFEEYGAIPKGETLIKLRNIYNLDLNWLLSDADEEPNTSGSEEILRIYKSFTQDQQETVLKIIESIHKMTLQK